jgi:hypothetical protein
LKIGKHLRVLSSGAALAEPLLTAYTGAALGALSGAANCQLGVHCHPGLVSCNTDAITTNTPN